MSQKKKILDEGIHWCFIVVVFMPDKKKQKNFLFMQEVLYWCLFGPIKTQDSQTILKQIWQSPGTSMFTIGQCCIHWWALLHGLDVLLGAYVQKMTSFYFVLCLQSFHIHLTFRLNQKAIGLQQSISQCCVSHFIKVFCAF